MCVFFWFSLRVFVVVFFTFLKTVSVFLLVFPPPTGQQFCFVSVEFDWHDSELIRPPWGVGNGLIYPGMASATTSTSATDPTSCKYTKYKTTGRSGTGATGYFDRPRVSLMKWFYYFVLGFCFLIGIFYRGRVEGEKKNYFKVVKKRWRLAKHWKMDTCVTRWHRCVYVCVCARMMCAAPARPRPPLRVTRERHPEHLPIKKLNVWPDNNKIEVAIFAWNNYIFHSWKLKTKNSFKEKSDVSKSRLGIRNGWGRQIVFKRKRQPRRERKWWTTKCGPRIWLMTSLI